MTIRITHIRMTPGFRDHEHITAVRWVDREDGSTGESSRGIVVKWIDDGGRAYVGTGTTQVAVATVHPTFGDPYLRTHADGLWTNNLLALDEF